MSSQPESAQAGVPPPAQPAEIRLDGSTFYVLHYFNDELGRKAMDEVITLFQQQQPQVKVAGESMDHETFKVAIPSLLESERPPDVFSYWAGARVQAVVDAGYFYPDANAYDWAEAASLVARGQAAMTLMGTWITGYYKNTLEQEADKDYSYFSFPLLMPAYR